jgi:hypothetical protein
MSTTAFSGSLVTFGNSPSASPDNANAGSSLFFGGAGILDTRFPYTYKPGQGALRTTAGWLGSANILTLNYVPYTKAVAAIAAAANVVANTAMTLVSAASATTGVSIVSSITNSLTGVADTNGGAGFVGIDTYTSVTASVSGNTLTVTANTSPTLTIGQTILTVGGAITGVTPVGMTIIGYGTGTGGTGTYTLSGTAGTAASGTITLQTPGPLNCLIPQGLISPYSFTGTPALWNPQALLGRAVAITAAAAASGTVVFTIKGYDIYGYPMIEQITAAANTQTLGKKAFKYIKSVTPSATDAQNYSVDTTDVIGFPIRSDFFGDVLINYSGSLSPAVITANTGYVASVQTAPTATTGDVRGTYALQVTSATNTNRLMIRQTPPPTNVISDAGLYGAVQYSTGF